MRFPGRRYKRANPAPAACAVLGLLGINTPVLAVDPVPIPPVVEACPQDIITRPKPIPAGPEGIPIELEGDRVEAIREDVIHLRGNATVQRGAQAMSADEITYHRGNDEVEGRGNVVLYSEGGDRLKTDEIKLQVTTFVGEAGESEYKLADRQKKSKESDKSIIRARGTAGKIYFEGHDVARMEDVTYTTCVEGNNDVMVYATDLRIDQATGRGVAENLRVHFKNVPVFYFPHVSFPINDDRKSGFLFPHFGVAERSGFVFGIPYYWNIAPNYDATITPRVYSERGVQVGAEFRYLTRDSRGYVYGEALPSDAKFNDDRAAFTYKHDQRFNDRLRGSVDVQWVSDSRYFDDFSNDIQISSATYLPQRAELRYSDRHWDLQGRVFAYQSVDDTVSSFNEPHDRLPQLFARGRYPKGPLGATYELETEVVNFAHKERLEGWRFDVTPSVLLPLETVWGYTKPKVSLRHTSYELSNLANPDDPSNPSRTLPVFSVDSGLFFERRSSWLDVPFIQTLEPRLFYVYIPYENQDDLPNFDTGEGNLNNFGNIFREHRFFGRDRVGDTNNLVLGVTSKMIQADTGKEWMNFSIGQAFFLQDRKVSLTGQVATEKVSDFLAEARADLSANWSTYGYLQWDHQENNVREGKLDVFFRMGPRKFIDLGYRYSRDSLEQVTLFAQWPLTPQWHMYFDERYSLRDKENLESKLGVEYDGCCWKTRAYVQRLRESDSTFRDAIVFELELTGLAKIRSGF